jgi:hypothetical protein
VLRSPVKALERCSSRLQLWRRVQRGWLLPASDSKPRPTLGVELGSLRAHPHRQRPPFASMALGRLSRHTRTVATSTCARKALKTEATIPPAGNHSVQQRGRWGPDRSSEKMRRRSAIRESRQIHPREPTRH